MTAPIFESILQGCEPNDDHEGEGSEDGVDCFIFGESLEDSEGEEEEVGDSAVLGRIQEFVKLRIFP